jgi:hypothetical protein
LTAPKAIEVIAGRARPFVCCVGVVWISLVGAAQAKPLTVNLAYTAGPGCPSATEFKAVVAGRLGYDPFADNAPDRVLVELVPRGGSMDGRLEWRDASGGWAGEQMFPMVTTDCARLARGVGFALAVQIQLLATVRAEPEPVAGPPPAAPSASSAPAPPRPAASVVPAAPAAPAAPSLVVTAPLPHRRGPGPQLALGFGPALGVGMSASPTLLGRLFGVLAWTRLSIELAAQTSLPTTMRRPDGSGFSQQHLLLGAAGCALFTVLTACLVANAGEVRMAGVDIDRPTSAVAPVIQAGARLGAVQRLGHRVVLGAHVDGLVAVTRWRGTLDGVPVWTAPRFAAVMAIDAAVRFP